MAAKTDFTDDEWQKLQLAIVDTIAYMSVVDPGLWASFKEAGAAARFVASRAQDSPSQLVRDLASDMHMQRDELLNENRANIEDPVLDRIEAAVAVVKQKTPEDLSAFRDLVSGTARAEAEATHGVTDQETAALEKIDEALGI